MPIGPAGRLLFAILGTDAVWKVLEKALDTIPKVLGQQPQPTPTSTSTDDSRARQQALTLGYGGVAYALSGDEGAAREHLTTALKLQSNKPAV